MSTYADLVAARDAGEITHLDYFQALRTHGLRHHGTVAMAMKANAGRARCYRDGVVRYTRTQRELSTEYLTGVAEGDDEVQARYARQLLRLDTVDQRIEAWAGARRFLNATPDAGRPSDALRSTVNSMRAGFAA